MAQSQSKRQIVIRAGHLANPVRAVLGSPPGFNIEAHQKTQENSSRPCINRLVWSLGPTMLIDDANPNDLAFVFP